MRLRLSICMISLIALLVSAATASGEEPKLPLTLTVTAGERDHTDAPVAFSLPPALAGAKGLRLVELADGKEAPVAFQSDSRDDARLWWIARGSFAAGTKRTYRLEKVQVSQPSGIRVAGYIDIVDSDRAIEARFGDKPLLRYNKGHVEPPEGVNPRYGRSAHLHPVWTPGGSIVTDELPPDHLHQSGIFLAYTKTQFEGRDVDFWNLGGGKGRVRFKERGDLTSGPVFGELQVTHEHVDLTAGDKSEIGKTTGGKVALNEEWNVRIWNVGLQSGYWLMDIASRASCAGDSPLRLPEYHYGGMAIRAARSWVPKEVHFLTSEGDDRLKGNHTRPRWCDIHGAIEGKMAGVALLTHPTNFRFPEPLRIHPTMPYMVYTPSFLGDWEIRPGPPHQSRYRFVIHDGQLSAETLEQLWRDFADPLHAIIE
jgi:methane monooxygenase PmoA-like